MKMKFTHLRILFNAFFQISFYVSIYLVHNSRESIFLAVISVHRYYPAKPFARLCDNTTLYLKTSVGLLPLLQFYIMKITRLFARDIFSIFRFKFCKIYMYRVIIKFKENHFQR